MSWGFPTPGLPRLLQEENPSPLVLPGEKGSAGRQLQPPQPRLCQCPPVLQLCPLPCPCQSTEVSQLACGVTAATAPAGADRSSPTPARMLEETPACLIPHHDELQARGRLSSRECELGYEQHNHVTPTATNRPRAPALMAQSTKHISCWSPQCPWLGLGRLQHSSVSPQDKPKHRLDRTRTAHAACQVPSHF